MQREPIPHDYARFVSIVQRANVIAAGADLNALLDQALALFIETAEGQAGTLYLYDPHADQLVFRVVLGDPASETLVGQRISADRGLAGAALHAGAPIFVERARDDPRWERRLGELADLTIETVYCLPLMAQDRPVGVVQVFNLPANAIDDPDEFALLELVGTCMVGAIEKARLLEDATRRERGLSALVEIISRLTTTLDRDSILTMIMTHARELLDVEATSVWQLDDEHGVLTPYVATGAQSDAVRQVSVPLGQGIIGHVVATGERMLVADVSKEQRHYQQADAQTGFSTRSVLCVPLRAPGIDLGPERGTIKSTTIGGAQAINKRGGAQFTPDDIALFETFASQAATVLQLSRLYAETNLLLLGMMKALADAVDARDRHNRQHSQRVSDFSVAIAEELGLEREEIYHVRIGSILHDIGKIGIPDAILDKPGQLTDEERVEMNSHTTKGFAILSQDELRRLLRAELPALLQHHERLDGKGYPHALRADQISQIARIVAVADVFDALTSVRPYRASWEVARTLAYLDERTGSEFDPACVAALIRARVNGKIVTQAEREKSKIDV
jgi:HD-GYP domain-containing protein (c-di-GMP phosphodiesterase class II)